MPIPSFGQSTKQSFNIDYMPIKLNGSDLWSIIDAKGNIIYEDEFPGNVSSAVNGYFIYRNGSRYSLYKVGKRPELVGNLTDVKAVGFPSEGLIPVVAKELDRIEYRHIDGTPAFTLKPVKGKEIRRVSNVFTDGLAIFMTDDWYWGAINPQGNIVISPDKYTWIYPFNENLAVAELDNGNNRRNRSIELERSYVVIDTKGNIVFKLKPDETPNRFFKDEKLVVNRKGGGAGYYNRFGEFHRFPPKVQEVDFINGNYVVYRSQPSEHYQRKPNNCGVIDLEGNTIIKPQYKYITSIDDKHFLAITDENDKKTYYIDNRNNVIDILSGWVTPIPEQYHSHPPMLTSGFSYMSEYPHNYLDSVFKPLVSGDLGRDGIEDDNVDPICHLILSDYFNPEETGSNLAARISANGLGGTLLGASADKIPVVANSSGSYHGNNRIIAGNYNLGHLYVQDIYHLNKSYSFRGDKDQAKIKYASTGICLETPTKMKNVSRIKKWALNSLLNRGFSIEEKNEYYTILKVGNGNIAFVSISGDYFSITLLPATVWQSEEKSLRQDAIESYERIQKRLKEYGSD